jgi:tRNA(fMet)-specific endonuclease VapC
LSLLKAMLDTNIASALVNQARSGAVFDKLVAFGVDRACISIITAAEIRFGVARRSSSRLERNVALLFETIQIVPFEMPADMRYAEIRAHLSNAGQIIGPNDLLIAAHARALDLTLVTDNVREFARVPDLRVENWLD